jgi:hypothetical protein
LQWKIILWMCQGSRCLFLMCENLSYILGNVMNFFLHKICFIFMVYANLLTCMCKLHLWFLFLSLVLF